MALALDKHPPACYLFHDTTVLNMVLKCIYKKCINSWNNMTTEINTIEKSKYANKLNAPDIDLLKLSRNKLKETITEHILTKYEN